MAKLQVSAAGWNAGKNYLAKSVRVEDVVIDPTLSSIFKIDEKTRAGIVKKMAAVGYDKSEPIVLWKGKNVLVDGHTRYAAARELGFDEIPAVEMEFTDEPSAILYCFERQKLRRNLSSAEILTAASLIENKAKHDGSGSAAERMAERVGMSAATLYKAKKVLKEAPKEAVEAIREGKTSIKKVYNTIKKRKESEPTEESAGPELPGLEGAEASVPAGGVSAGEGIEDDVRAIFEPLRKAILVAMREVTLGRNRCAGKPRADTAMCEAGRLLTGAIEVIDDCTGTGMEETDHCTGTVNGAKGTENTVPVQEWDEKGTENAVPVQ